VSHIVEQCRPMKRGQERRELGCDQDAVPLIDVPRLEAKRPARDEVRHEGHGIVARPCESGYRKARCDVRKSLQHRCLPIDAPGCRLRPRELHDERAADDRGALAPLRVRSLQVGRDGDGCICEAGDGSCNRPTNRCLRRVSQPVRRRPPDAPRTGQRRAESRIDVAWSSTPLWRGPYVTASGPATARAASWRQAGAAGCGVRPCSSITATSASTSGGPPAAASRISATS